MTIATLERPQSTAKTSDLEHLTVAAVDESVSIKNKYLTYMTVVCSVGNGHKRLFPTDYKAYNAFNYPTAFDLVVVSMMLPPWANGAEREDFWMRGVWYGLSFTDSVLKRNGQKGIDIAFVDGLEPELFRKCGRANHNLSVNFESKYGTHHYMPDVDPLAADMLKLAHRVVAHVRQKIDKKHRLERLVAHLSQTKRAFINLAPELPYQEHPVREILGSYHYKPF